jgi:KaiC/GvpD/RAD55 family RecA-like ATPase
MASMERVPTGIPGLDEMLRGGLPQGRTVLLLGGPGAGKTILAVQFLVKGIYEHNENGVYVSLDESREELYAEMKAFGWRLEEAEKAGRLSFVDAHPRRVRRFDLDRLFSQIRREVKRVSAKRIVVDPLTSLVLVYPDVVRRREAILDIFSTLNELGTTNIATLELRARGVERGVHLEEYLANGVILLQRVRVGRTMTKIIEIEKMRGIEHDDQPRPYRITEMGIEVYSGETVF